MPTAEHRVNVLVNYSIVLGYTSPLPQLFYNSRINTIMVILYISHSSIDKINCLILINIMSHIFKLARDSLKLNTKCIFTCAITPIILFSPVNYLDLIINI